MRDAVSAVQQSFDNVTRILNPQVRITFSVMIVALLKRPIAGQSQDLVKSMIHMRAISLVFSTVLSLFFGSSVIYQSASVFKHSPLLVA